MLCALFLLRKAGEGCVISFCTLATSFSADWLKSLKANYENIGYGLSWEHRTYSYCLTQTHKLQADQFFLYNIVESPSPSFRTVQITQKQEGMARGIVVKIQGSSSVSLKHHKQKHLSWVSFFKRVD